MSTMLKAIFEKKNKKQKTKLVHYDKSWGSVQRNKKHKKEQSKKLTGGYGKFSIYDMRQISTALLLNQH